MVFSSLFFIFFFLTLVYGLYAFMPSLKARNGLLLGASLVFYAWGGPRYLLLLCAMVLICWVGALMIGEARGSRSLRRFYLVATVAACLAILGVFKYTDFLVGSFEALFGMDERLPGIVLPIGISFYTFQLISYVADVYKGDARPQENYFRLLLYAALFHQCIAGPIVRYTDVCRELDDREMTLKDTWAGLARFTVGLGKKAILANACASVADRLLPASGEGLAEGTSLSVLLGLCAFMLQIYLDFSAYSDMAIGMGRMIGFHFRENFNYPYTAVSVTDFWRRWHISLSSFFRDYVYIPLGGSRVGTGRHIMNLLAVWALTGLWHGASWTYVLWGLYFCAFLLLEKFVFRWHPTDTGARWKTALRRVYTLVVVLFGWLIFRFEDISLLGTALRTLFGANGFAGLTVQTIFTNNLFILCLSALACTPVVPLIAAQLTAARQRSGMSARLAGLTADVIAAAAPALLLVLSALALVGTSAHPFLYFNF